MVNSDIAEIILAQIEELSPYATDIVHELRPHANQSTDACPAIILVGADPTPALALAQQRVETYIAPKPRVHEPGPTTSPPPTVQSSRLLSTGPPAIASPRSNAATYAPRRAWLAPNVASSPE
jgi:hypothetical protein